MTPVYNGEKTIARTIESVLNQTISPYEYIIVDGASSDETIEIAKAFRLKFEAKNIRYVIISEKDNGIYASV